MALDLPDAPGRSSIAFCVETVRVAELKPHPRNYRHHPPDQLEHIVQSIRQHGLYRNVVIAREGTILAGHGVVLGCRQLGLEEIPVVRMDVEPDSPAALKLLAGDNEIGHLAEVDDATFTGILTELKDLGELLGTGYDDMMLQNLLYVTRPPDILQDADEDAIWREAGMPEYENGPIPVKLIISFRSDLDRARFVEQTHLEIKKREAKTWMTWWPFRDTQDTRSLRFEEPQEQPV